MWGHLGTQLNNEEVRSTTFFRLVLASVSLTRGTRDLGAIHARTSFADPATPCHDPVARGKGTIAEEITG